MPEAALKFVYGVGFLIITIDGLTTVRDVIFSLVGCMPNANPYRLWGLQQTLFLPVQPFQGDFGVVCGWAHWQSCWVSYDSGAGPGCRQREW